MYHDKSIRHNEKGITSDPQLLVFLQKHSIYQKYSIVNIQSNNLIRLRITEG